MPIISSEIIEDSQQSNGRRIVEEHTDTTGRKHTVSYNCELSFDAETAKINRVLILDQMLIDNEISTFLNNIESGNPVLSLGYTETTTIQRFEALHEWGKDMIRANNYQAMRYLPDTLDQVTDQQLDNLVGETVRIKIRVWAEKLTAMNLAVVGVEV